MSDPGTGVVRDIIHININVTDVERSLAFYERLGFRVMHVFGNRETDDVSEGMDFQGGRCRGAVLTLGDHPRCFTKLELIEWVEPKVEPSAPPSLHASGISRIALRTKNLLDFVAGLKRDGVVFETEVQEIDLVGASRFVVLRDPDGVPIELVEL